METLGIVISAAHIAAAIALLNGVFTTLDRLVLLLRQLNPWRDNQKPQMIFAVLCLLDWRLRRLQVFMGF